jgi:hypothetical protein
MRRLLTIGLGLAGPFFVTSAVSDDYSFDFGASYGRTQFEYASTAVVDGSGFLSAGTVNANSESDTDTFRLFGTWYFAGLSDDNGPRARAAFVDRASAVTALYSRQEESSSFSSMSSVLEIPSAQGTSDASSDVYAVRGRWVGRTSGWFGEASIAEVDSSSGNEPSTWSLGVGKYLFDTTALSVSAGNIDQGFGFDADVYALGFTHLGSVGQSWQYAFELGYEFQSFDSDFVDDANNWNTAIALYPTRDVEFGIAYANTERSFDVQSDSSIEGYASWFVTPTIKLGARYRVDGFDNVFPTVTGGGIDSSASADQDSFTITFNMRF